MADLGSLFQYYLDNQDELVKKYDGKYLIICDNNVVNAFSSENEAYMYAKEKYGLGNFLLQLCTKGPEAYSQHFRSRVAFV
nr:MAG TPA: hypothetical protein [Caudoviricetes sp.]